MQAWDLGGGCTADHVTFRVTAGVVWASSTLSLRRRHRRFQLLALQPRDLQQLKRLLWLVLFSSSIDLLLDASVCIRRRKAREQKCAAETDNYWKVTLSTRLINTKCDFITRVTSAHSIRTEGRSADCVACSVDVVVFAWRVVWRAPSGAADSSVCLSCRPGTYSTKSGTPNKFMSLRVNPLTVHIHSSLNSVWAAWHNQVNCFTFLALPSWWYYVYILYVAD